MLTHWQFFSSFVGEFLKWEEKFNKSERNNSIFKTQKFTGPRSESIWSKDEQDALLSSISSSLPLRFANFRSIFFSQNPFGSGNYSEIQAVFVPSAVDSLPGPVKTIGFSSLSRDNISRYQCHIHIIQANYACFRALDTGESSFSSYLKYIASIMCPIFLFLYSCFVLNRLLRLFLRALFSLCVHFIQFLSKFPGVCFYADLFFLSVDLVGFGAVLF